jgi:hypothetical protein
MRNEQLHDLCLPNVTRMVNSRRMSWARRIIRVGEKRNTHRVLVRKT